MSGCLAEQPLTVEAREALALSRGLCRHPVRDDRDESAAVLVALQRHEGSFAAAVLASLGVRPDELERQLEACISSTGHGDKPRSSLVVSLTELRWRRWQRASPEALSSPPPESVGVLEHAHRQANTLGHDHIGTLHLLLGLLEEPEGVAAPALTGLGVQPPELRRRVLEMLRNGEYREKKPITEHTSSGSGDSRTAGRSIRLEALSDKRMEDELAELLILTGIVEVPDESSPPGGLSPVKRTEPPEIDRELDRELAARVERAARELDERLRLMQSDLAGLEMARDKLAEFLPEND